MREKDGGKPITGQQKHWMVGLPAPDARPRRRQEARESPVDCKISIGNSLVEETYKTNRWTACKIGALCQSLK